MVRGRPVARLVLQASGLCFLLGDRVVAHQPTRPPDLVHDLVAGVDAQRALDALELRAVANVDAGRADDDAGLAVDAVATPVQLSFFLCGPRGSPRSG